jgi:hypothetical protein
VTGLKLLWNKIPTVPVFKSETIQAIGKFFLNGIYSYVLFCIYALTLSPIVSEYFNFGGKNLFIAILGFSIFIGEFFAFKYKLKIIEIEAELKRKTWFEKTGEDIIPRVGYLIWYAFIMRLCFRMVIIMVSMTALGFDCNEKTMSIPGLIVMLTAFFLDVCGAGYLYVTSTLFSDAPMNSRDLKEEKKEQQEWNQTNFPKEETYRIYKRNNLYADIVLVVYGFIVYTSFWQFINDRGLLILEDAVVGNSDAENAFFQVFPMLFFMIFVGLMPARLAYWIQDSVKVFSKKEKFMMYLTFLIASILTCLPCIVYFFQFFVLK